VGGLAGRVTRLEGRTRPAQKRTRSEPERFKHWRARAAISRREATPKCAYHARSLTRWLVMTGNLPGNAEALIARIMGDPHDASGFMQPPETRSHSVVSWEVYRAIWRAEEGLEAMEPPDEWRAAFEAAEMLRGIYREVPAEELARWVLEAVEAQEEGGEEANNEINRRMEHYLEERGITPALLDQAVGPEASEIPPEERCWRLSELGAEDMDGPRGWEIHKAVTRLANERDVLARGGK
jgi:hypothetical protein